MKFKLQPVNKTSAVLDINDMIGQGGFSAGDMRKALDSQAKAVKKLTVRLCSDGGVITEGLAIYNMLRAHKAKVRIEITGIAASMGSVIAMAGDEIAMAEDSWLMIHNPSGGVRGESDDMRKQADIQDGMRDQIAGIYARRTGIKPDAARALMAKETWMTAKQALAAGFCTEVIPATKMTASLKTRRFKNKPKALRRATNERENMDPELLAKLGLPDDATLEDVLAAIDALMGDEGDGEPDNEEGGDDDEDPPENEDDPEEKPENGRRARAAALAALARRAEARKSARRPKAPKGTNGSVIALLTEMRNEIRSVAGRVDGGEREALIAANIQKFSPGMEKAARKWPIAQVREFIANAVDIEPAEEGEDRPAERASARRGGTVGDTLTKEQKNMARVLGYSESAVLAFIKNGNKLPPKASK